MGEDPDIRPAGPHELDRMMAVWRDAFGPGYQGGNRAEDVLRWQLDGAENGHRRWGWIAQIDDDPVGAWLSLPTTLWARGRPIDAHWLMSTAIVERAQRRGLGRKIYRRIVAAEKLVLGVGVMVGSRALYQSEKACFVPADTLGRLEFSTVRGLRNILGLVRQGRFAAAGTRLSALLRRQLAPPRVVKGLEIVIEDRVPETIDAFIERALSGVPVCLDRNRAFLERLMVHPRFDATLFIAREAGEVAGYALVRSDGMILDLLCTESETTATAIIAAVATWGRAQGLDGLSAMYGGQPFPKSAYIAMGFTEYVQGFGLFFVPTGDSDLDALLAEPSNWRISMADSDLWSFRLG